jgi:hypothetical protein
MLLLVILAMLIVLLWPLLMTWLLRARKRRTIRDSAWSLWEPFDRKRRREIERTQMMMLRDLQF